MKCPICDHRIEDAIRLPRQGQTYSVTVGPGAIIGTLEVDGERIQVYLGEMEAAQCGGEPCIGQRTTSQIKRMFTFIEV